MEFWCRREKGRGVTREQLFEEMRRHHLKRIYDMVKASGDGGVAVGGLREMSGWTDDYVVDLLEQLVALGLIERFQWLGSAKSGILKGWHFRVLGVDDRAKITNARCLSLMRSLAPRAVDGIRGRDVAC